MAAAVSLGIEIVMVMEPVSVCAGCRVLVGAEVNAIGSGK